MAGSDFEPGPMDDLEQTEFIQELGARFDVDPDNWDDLSGPSTIGDVWRFIVRSRTGVEPKERPEATDETWQRLIALVAEATGMQAADARWETRILEGLRADLASATPNPGHIANCERLVRQFEGREAVYIEKGILRVRVSDIRFDAQRKWISANIRELPTVGLEHTEPGLLGSTGPRPLRSKIGGGEESTFSASTWRAGYGGWSMFFAPEDVARLVRVASEFTDDMTPYDRYTKLVVLFTWEIREEREQPIFPD